MSELNILSTQNIQEYKKVKFENGNMYLNDKRIGLEIFSQGKNIFISDHSLNLYNNIDLSGYLISDKIQIGEHTYLDGSNNIIYGDLTISGDLSCLAFDAPNQIFTNNNIESIFVKKITTNNSLIIHIPIINFSELQLNDISMIDLIIYGNSSCKKMDISNNSKLNNLTLYSEENIDISFNFNLNDDLTINGDVSINNIDISNNLVLDRLNNTLIIDQSLNIMKNGIINNNEEINTLFIRAVDFKAIQRKYEIGTNVKDIIVVIIKPFTDSDTIFIDISQIDISDSECIFNNISGENIDVSNIHIKNNLVVDNSFILSNVIENINVINNELLITAQVDISHSGSGPSLIVSQKNETYPICLFDAGEEGNTMKIENNGNALLYKHTDVCGNMDVCGNVDVLSAYIYGNVDLCRNLDISGTLTILKNVNIGSNLDICGELKIIHDSTETLYANIENKNIIVNANIQIDNSYEFQGRGMIPIGGIIFWSGSITDLPHGWTLCDGNDNTPDLRGKFIMSSTYGENVNISDEDASYNIDQTGGLQQVTLEDEEMPKHEHTIESDSYNHNHSMNTYNANVGVNSGGSHYHSYPDRFSGWYEGQGDHYSLRFHGGEEAWQGKFNYSYQDDNTSTNDIAAHTHSISLSQHNHACQDTSITHSHGDTSNTGEDSQHENKPPYYVLAYIMRIY